MMVVGGQEVSLGKEIDGIFHPTFYLLLFISTGALTLERCKHMQILTNMYPLPNLEPPCGHVTCHTNSPNQPSCQTHVSSSPPPWYLPTTCPGLGTAQSHHLRPNLQPPQQVGSPPGRLRCSLPMPNLGWGPKSGNPPCFLYISRSGMGRA
jgi:hypothetical protein